MAIQRARTWRDIEQIWRRGLQHPTQGKLLRDAVTIEPLLGKVFQLAADSRSQREREHWQRYTDLKLLAACFVGEFARTEALQDSTYYDAVGTMIEDLLPEMVESDEDWRTFDLIEDPLATCPGLRPPGVQRDKSPAEDKLRAAEAAHDWGAYASALAAWNAAERDQKIAWLAALRIPAGELFTNV